MFKVYFLIPILIPLALIKGDFSLGVCHRFGRWLSRVAARPALALALVGLLSLFISFGFGIGAGIPVPEIHDEFGYLLLGDTFAHGRLTNPTPPMWEHFETIHEIMRPTYASKYPPAQGLALAIGQILWKPILGVWLTTALACAAMCWMFYAWLPARWALAGGLMVALHPQTLEWSQDYWGGAIALGAGALVAGGFRRLLDTLRARDSTAMGIGIALLANSRPYEGLVFSVLTGLALLMWMVKRGGIPWALFLRRVVFPMACVFALLACQLGYYNWRVTGNPLLMPYTVHIQTYAIDPLFVFSPPRKEPVYRHREIQNLQEQYLQYYEQERTSWTALVEATLSKAAFLFQAYLWSLLFIVPLLALPWALRRDSHLQVALLIGLFFLALILIETWMHSHYAAPGAPLFFVLVIASMRELGTWHSHGRRWGRTVIRGMAVLMALSTVVTVVKLARKDPGRTAWFSRRMDILDALNREPQGSLVIVSYQPDHDPNCEWVYNGADIPGSRVILARDMGREQNAELIAHYPGRKVWMINADAPQPSLEPYPGT